jgi:4-amino-4-deoxy-L-arabinose transferase-like glycosyltransferase
MLRFMLALVMLVSTLFYGLFVWRDAPFEMPDTSGYIVVADDLRDGSLNELHGRTIGYPLLLMLTGTGDLLYWTQLILHHVAAWLVLSVLLSLEVRRSLVLLAAVVLISPPFVEHAANILTESLTTFLLVGGFIAWFYWIRRGNAALLIIGAAALGFSGLVRPTYQVITVGLAVLVLLGIWVLRKDRLMVRRLAISGAAMLIAGGVFIGGMLAHNGARFGYSGLSPLAGFHLSTRTVPLVERLPDTYAVERDILVKYRDEHLIQPGSSHQGFAYIWDARGELMTTLDMDNVQLSNHMLRLNLMLIRESPLEYLAIVGGSIVSYWFPISARANFDSTAIRLGWSAGHFLLVALFFASILAVGTLAIIVPRLWRSTPTGTLRVMTLVGALAIIFFTFVISVAIEIGINRYRVPTEPLIVLATCISIEMLTKWVKTLRAALASESGG